MQTLRQIRELLAEAGLSPRKRLGQRFLIDKNLLGKLLDLAGLTGAETVLEVGAGTGSLTEELLSRSVRVVAVEIDRGLTALLQRRLGDRDRLCLIGGDVLAGKHKISPAVLAELGGSAHLVANLPFQIATPLIAECLTSSWRAAAGKPDACRFQRLTFTVQREAADRLLARPGGGTYSPVSVLVALLGRLQRGPAVPAEAFWPRPNVVCRMVRIDFDESAAGRLHDIDMLQGILRLAFGQRRKQIGSVLRKAGEGFPPGLLAGAAQTAGIDPAIRPERIGPERYLTLANVLAQGR